MHRDVLVFCFSIGIACDGRCEGCSKRYGSIMISFPIPTQTSGTAYRQRPRCNITVSRRNNNIHTTTSSHARQPVGVSLVLCSNGGGAPFAPISLCPNSLCSLFFFSRGRAGRISLRALYGTAAVVCRVCHCLPAASRLEASYSLLRPR